jgi:metal-dependent amidase/aminoacylase/carboxypeptidase family protein
MTLESAVVFAILFAAVAMFISGRLRMDMTALLVLALLALTGILTPAEAFAGFSSPAVITVGSIHGGTKHNIIGDSCHLQLTVRSYSDAVRQQLLEAIERKAKAGAAGMRAPEPEIDVSKGTPALFNDEELAAHLRGVFEDLLGADHVIEPEPSMGGEDFGRYGREGVPIVMYALGSIEMKRLERYKELGQSPPSLHSPHYYPDVEPTLVTGIRTMVAVALDLLPPPAED